jgi:hypothetical protein
MQSATQPSLLTLFAVLLALVVFVPDVAITGAWAHPTPVSHTDRSADTTTFAPAQLIRPERDSGPDVPLVLLVIGSSACLLRPRPVSSAARWTWSWMLGPPGRCGRPVLQAYLN